jgi:hypothetical protein
MKNKIAVVVAAGLIVAAQIDEASADTPEVLTRSQMAAVEEFQMDSLDEVVVGENEWVNSHFHLGFEDEPLVLDSMLVEC